MEAVWRLLAEAHAESRTARMLGSLERQGRARARVEALADALAALGEFKPGETVEMALSRHFWAGEGEAA